MRPILDLQLAVVDAVLFALEAVPPEQLGEAVRALVQPYRPFGHVGRLHHPPRAHRASLGVECSVLVLDDTQRKPIAWAVGVVDRRDAHVGRGVRELCVCTKREARHRKNFLTFFFVVCARAHAHRIR